MIPSGIQKRTIELARATFRVTTAATTIPTCALARTSPCALISWNNLITHTASLKLVVCHPPGKTIPYAAVSVCLRALQLTAHGLEMHVARMFMLAMHGKVEVMDIDWCILHSRLLILFVVRRLVLPNVRDLRFAGAWRP
eukprot:6983638-Pyramimonas_sp.AAC.1